jgi:hypothetical protein
MSWIKRGLFGVALAASGVCAAATEEVRVKVQYAGDTELYADLGEFSSDREDNLAALTAVFAGLSKRLPPGMTLDVVVSDVNLAGELEWVRSAAKRMRVMRNIGWPMIELSYTLKQGDKVVQQGKQRVSDMSYLTTRPMGMEAQRLAYEERMLQDWLKGVIAAR